MKITLNLLRAALALFLIMFSVQFLGFTMQWLSYPIVIAVLVAIVVAPFELLLRRSPDTKN